MATTTVNGIEMGYDDRGNGEPLILLHGFLGSGADWSQVFDLSAMGREHRLIVPDLRGHGRSADPSGAFTFRQCARDVFALLDHLGVHRFRAVGLSLGADALLHLATLEPGRVDAMILVSATPYFPEQARVAMRALAADHPPEEWAQLRAVHPHGDPQIRALWRIGAGFAESHDDLSFTPPHLGTITARALIVNGDRDPLYPVELSLELYRSIPRSSLWILPDAGHAPVFGEAREPFARKAAAFLRGDPAPPAGA
jgi:pimeloyl-ACP methyl ester carboxylesterase